MVRTGLFIDNDPGALILSYLEDNVAKAGVRVKMGLNFPFYIYSFKKRDNVSISHEL